MKANIIDRLIDKIDENDCPIAAGLDTRLEYLPESLLMKVATLDDAAKAITEFNVRLIDELKDFVPCVKVQVAYYEMYGAAGMRAFSDTLSYAKENGLITIADVKRNDIGSTAACYSAAYLGKTHVGTSEVTPFESDFVTVNAYLGSDGIIPFMDDCIKYDRGVFALVKTSNPSGSQLQDLKLEGGEKVYERMGALVKEWGKPHVGKYGYSRLGAVVGATYPAEASELREALGSVFFLVPGYGAQGATADDITHSFDANGRGAVVNNSRGLLLAYKDAKYARMDFAAAAKAAAENMQKDIYAALKRAGKVR